MNPNPEKCLHVLVCPLNWGLGHASRCIPVITALLKKGANVTIAAAGPGMILLKKEFPSIEIIEFRSFSPRYPVNGQMLFKMFRLIPEFLGYIIYEHFWLKFLLKTRKIDIVISDNRYGLWHRKVRSILITHQVFIRAPKGWQWFAHFLKRINYFLINRFDECWIPDHPGIENLSGELSHLQPLPAKYFFVGPLSRLKNLPGQIKASEGILVVLSGPEPQRSILEQILLKQLNELKAEALIIRGLAEDKQQLKQQGKLTLLNFADSGQINEYLCKYPLLICRPGYSTIMDLEATGGKALFIPTPGQTEQEYLAELFMQRGIAMKVNQQDVRLDRDIPLSLKYQGFHPLTSNPLIDQRIEMLTVK